MMLDIYTSAEIGHMTERFIPFQKSVTKIRLVRTKVFQFETQFCHVTTNVAYELCFVRGTLNHIVEMNQK